MIPQGSCFLAGSGRTACQAAGGHSPQLSDLCIGGWVVVRAESWV